MSEFTRREVLAGTAAAAAASLVLPGDLAAQGQTLKFEPEKNAQLRVLRWRRFVQGDEDMWAKNTEKFTQATGVKVRVDAESWEDVRPKAAVAANVGSGPDIIISTFDDPHQYPDKLVDVSDLAEYLGNKYGGWYDVCRSYGTRDGKRWIALPMGGAGNCIVYRESHMKAAGFEQFPRDHAGFLKLCQGLKAKGTPPGFALGNATGDGNSWTHWLLWSHGGRLVDDKNNVVINSPETIAALEYGRQLYETFVPGTLSWLDPNNNKAFIDGQISLTANGISIYYAAKTSQDPNVKALASDINHANFPVGPAGKPTELNLMFQAMLFKHSKYPKAAKEYLRFMWEREQYVPWQQAAIGYVTQPLKAYEANPIWTEDPKHTPYRDAIKVMLPNGYSGKLGYASAASMADFIVVNMVAAAVSGSKSPKDAAAEAEKRALRYYKV